MQTKGCIFMVMVSPSVNKSLDEALLFLTYRKYFCPLNLCAFRLKETTYNAGDPGLDPWVKNPLEKGMANN